MIPHLNPKSIMKTETNLDNNISTANYSKEDFIKEAQIIAEKLADIEIEFTKRVFLLPDKRKGEGLDRSAEKRLLIRSHLARLLRPIQTE